MGRGKADYNFALSSAAAVAYLAQAWQNTAQSAVTVSPIFLRSASAWQKIV